MSCRTWRLSSPPDVAATLVAEELPDHRLMYLDYEGPVSGNRGTVIPWDVGRFHWMTATESQISVWLEGIRWSGKITLKRLASGWSAEALTANTTGRTFPA